MEGRNYFKVMFESICDYKKIVLLIFLIKSDIDLLYENGFLKNDNNRLNIEFKKILLDQSEEYLNHVKNQEESITEKILNK